MVTRTQNDPNMRPIRRYRVQVLVEDDSGEPWLDSPGKVFVVETTNSRNFFRQRHRYAQTIDTSASCMRALQNSQFLDKISMNITKIFMLVWSDDRHMTE